MPLRPHSAARLDGKVDSFLVSFTKKQPNLVHRYRPYGNGVDARELMLVARELDLTPLLGKGQLADDHGVAVTHLTVKRSGPNTVATLILCHAQH